jgi:serine/threonine protein kinase/tetratricopeptide (TPR) repeat protein
MSSTPIPPDRSEPPTVLKVSSEATASFAPDSKDAGQDSTAITSTHSRDSTGFVLRTDQNGSQATTLTAETIHGYEILDVLGRGSMGIVYKALQPGLKRIVALKMILSGEFAGSQELVRFRGEAEVIARLQHPNIVQIYEIGSDKGRPFFSMEFVEGTSLAKKIAATPQSPREAAHIVQLLATAMQTAHAKKIVHRDIKPANVLVAVDGTPKITDFGLAKTLEEHSSQTHSGTILGTPSYMAPEQAEGRVLDIGPHSDIYSLGAVLYELLTGRAPFKGGSVLDTLEQVRTMEPVAPIQFAPSMPRDLETICLKCLQKDPAKRYETATALAEDLGRFLAGEPILARPISSPERFWRWCRRNPGVAVLSGIVFLAVVAWAITTSVLAFSIKREKDKTDVARLAAEQNAERADKNAEIAKNNETTAKNNEAIAKANAELAQKNALAALQSHQFVVTRMLDLGKQLQERLSTRRMGSAPEIRSVRDDLLKLLRETVVVLGKDLEKLGVTAFAMPAAHQQLGDLLVRIGLGEQALDQFRKAQEHLKKVVALAPNDDKARANLSVILFRLGDIALDTQGDAPVALKYYRESYDLLKEIADHPRSGDYTITDNKRLLAFADVHLGKVYLALGDLDAANRCFEESLTFRQFWLEKAKQKVSVESYLCESYMLLGITAGRMGDAQKAFMQFGKSLELCESLVKRFPNDTSFKADLADISGNRGDSQFRLGQFDEAEKSYQKLRENLLIVLNFNTQDTSRQSLTALTHERLAAILLHRHEVDEANKRYQEALNIREDMLKIEPNNQVWKAAYALALARVGKITDATKVAEELCVHCPNSAVILLEVARAYASCAKSETDEQKKQQLIEKSNKALQSVIATGWKDARLIESDPDLEAIRNDMGFREVMEKIRGKMP